MSLKRLLAAGAIATAAYGGLSMLRAGQATASMHPDDWLEGAGVRASRRYRSLPQVTHHLTELASQTVPLARVYLLRAISPAFREQVMIVTALANDCSP